MRKQFFLALLASLGVLGCYSALAQQSTTQEKPTSQATDEAKPKRKVDPATQLVPNAKAFLESLSAEQRQKALLDYDSEKRVQWHFIPMATRKGLPVMEMDEAQKEAAMKLLRASLSKVGYEKATTIMKLESVLKLLEGGKGQNERNPEKYYFTIFGQPGPKKHWGLSIEGHHLSLNFVMQGNKVVDSTPQFFASNPSVLKDSYGEFEKGFEVLKQEEQLGFKLMKSLTSEQREKAMLPGDTPSEIRAAGEKQPPVTEAQGIRVAELSEEQQSTLRALLTAYTSKMKPLVAKERWEAIEEAGFEQVAFGWTGGMRAGVGHYYIVQGPSFLVEFINVQPDPAGNPANHIHCVWRDLSGDFDLPIAAK